MKFSWENGSEITEKSDYGRLKNGNGKRIEDPPQESKQTENRAGNRKNVQNLQTEVQHIQAISDLLNPY